MFATDKWVPRSLAEWLTLLRESIQKSCGVTTEVTDQTYVLARLVIEIGKFLSDIDRGVSESLMVADVTNAVGVALDVAMWRIGLRRLLAEKTQMGVTVYGTPGTILNGELIKNIPTSTKWQLGAVVIGVTGTALATAFCTEYGPIEPVTGENGTKDKWTLESKTNGFISVSSGVPRKLGRFTESDAEFRLRGEGYLARGGGTEGAVWNAVASVSGVGAHNAQVYPNRTGDVVDGIPPHYLEAVVRNGLDNEIAQALYDTASATAGFHGNSVGYAGNIQFPSVAVGVPFSRVETLRVFATATVIITGAENAPSVAQQPAYAAHAAAVLSQWGTPVDKGGTLESGVNPTTAAASAFIVANTPVGSSINVFVIFSFDGVLYNTSLEITKRQDFVISNEPSFAQVIGTEGPVYAITNGWSLVLRVTINGVPGLDQNIVFTGVETDPVGVVFRINNTAPVGIVAFEVGSTIGIRTIAMGANVQLTVRPATTDALAFVLGIVEGTNDGRDTDILVNLF